jgi:hypothetical protein
VTNAAGALPGQHTGQLYAPPGGRRSPRLLAKALLALTKPRIIAGCRPPS